MLLTAVIVGSLCTVVGALTVVVAIRKGNAMAAWTKKAALNEEDIGIALLRAVSINEKCEAVYLEHRDPRLLVMAKDSKEIHTRLSRVMYRTYGQGRLFDGEDQDPEALG